MMNHRQRMAAASVAAVCAVAGAAAGITGAFADSSGDNGVTMTIKTNNNGITVKTNNKNGWPSVPGLPSVAHLSDRLSGLGIGGPPVHADAVVPDGKGNFRGVAFDQGKVVSVSGDTLTIEEGADGKTYKKVDVQIPGDAGVTRNFEDAKLGDLKAGDHVAVVRTDGGGIEVTAFDDDHAPRLPWIP
jgi:hypothetical protein